MVKKIFYILSGLLILSVIAFEYFRTETSEIQKDNAITAVPLNASFIIECTKPVNKWNEIISDNLILKDIKQIVSVSKFVSDINYLDSLIAGNNKINNIINRNNLYISGHKTGMNDFGFLFVCSIPLKEDQVFLSNFIDTVSHFKTLTRNEYGGVVIYGISQPNKSDFYYTIDKGIFIASLNNDLIKESIRQLGSGISLLNNKVFIKVLNASGSHVSMKLFINCKTLSNAIQPFSGKNFHSVLSSIPDFAGWSCLDVSIGNDEAVLNGFTSTDSAESQYLGLFSNKAIHEIQIASVLPSNTIFLACMELNNYKDFINEYDKLPSLHAEISNRESWIKNINQKYKLDIENYFYSRMIPEVALVITQTSDTNIQDNAYTIVSSDNIEYTTERLDSLSDSIARSHNNKPADTLFMEHHIHLIPIENLPEFIYGSAFKMVKNCWWTTSGNYVIIGNSLHSLEKLINRTESGFRLDKNPEYMEFIKKHYDNAASIYIYSNLSMSIPFYKNYLNNKYSDIVEKNKIIFEKLQGLSIQFTYAKGMYYTNIYLERKSETNKQATTLWQFALDTAISYSPCWVTDFVTGYKYVFTQDRANSIYIISNTGHKLWQRKIAQPIISTVFGVDALKNNKIQYLFNTKNKIYLVDRNGNDLHGFPLEIPHNASGAITLLDFDSNKAYRILVPCADLKIREYDLSGKPVRDWKVPETGNSVVNPIQYMKIKNKDYIIAVDKSGKVYGYDRRGEKRMNLLNKLPENCYDYYILQGDKLNNSFLFASDARGTIYRLGFDDVLTRNNYLSETGKYISFKPSIHSGSWDEENMYYLLPNDVYAFNSAKTKLYECHSPDLLDKEGLTVNRLGNTFYIGAVSSAVNKLYLWDNNGKHYPGFPLYGSTSFTIGDMNNDGQHYLLTGAADNNIYVYIIP